jgi:riboflavin synthase alpha subunit
MPSGLQDFRRDSDSLWVRLAAPESLLKYIVPKGYVAIDGTSLTIVDVRRGSSAENASSNSTAVQLQSGEAGWFSFMLVSHTQQCIIMPLKKGDDLINIEVDVMAKYVESALAAKAPAQAPHSGTLTLAAPTAPLVLSAAAFLMGAAALIISLRSAAAARGKR